MHILDKKHAIKICDQNRFIRFVRSQFQEIILPASWISLAGVTFVCRESGSPSHPRKWPSFHYRAFLAGSAGVSLCILFYCKVNYPLPRLNLPPWMRPVAMSGIWQKRARQVGLCCLWSPLNRNLLIPERRSMALFRDGIFPSPLQDGIELFSCIIVFSLVLFCPFQPITAYQYKRRPNHSPSSFRRHFFKARAAVYSPGSSHGSIPLSRKKKSRTCLSEK